METDRGRSVLSHVDHPRETARCRLVKCPAASALNVCPQRLCRSPCHCPGLPLELANSEFTTGPVTLSHVLIGSETRHSEQPRILEYLNNYDPDLTSPTSEGVVIPTQGDALATLDGIEILRQTLTPPDPEGLPDPGDVLDALGFGGAWCFSPEAIRMESHEQAGMESFVLRTYNQDRHTDLQDFPVELVLMICSFLTWLDANALQNLNSRFRGLLHTHMTTRLIHSVGRTFKSTRVAICHAVPTLPRLPLDEVSFIYSACLTDTFKPSHIVDRDTFKWVINRTDYLRLFNRRELHNLSDYLLDISSFTWPDSKYMYLDELWTAFRKLPTRCYVASKSLFCPHSRTVVVVPGRPDIIVTTRDITGMAPPIALTYYSSCSCLSETTRLMSRKEKTFGAGKCFNKKEAFVCMSRHDPTFGALAAIGYKPRVRPFKLTTLLVSFLLLFPLMAFSFVAVTKSPEVWVLRARGYAPRRGPSQTPPSEPCFVSCFKKMAQLGIPCKSSDLPVEQDGGVTLESAIRHVMKYKIKLRSVRAYSGRTLIASVFNQDVLEGPLNVHLILTTNGNLRAASNHWAVEQCRKEVESGWYGSFAPHNVKLALDHLSDPNYPSRGVSQDQPEPSAPPMPVPPNEAVIVPPPVVIPQPNGVLDHARMPSPSAPPMPVASQDDDSSSEASTEDPVTENPGTHLDLHRAFAKLGGVPPGHPSALGYAVEELPDVQVRKLVCPVCPGPSFYVVDSYSQPHLTNMMLVTKTVLPTTTWWCSPLPPPDPWSQLVLWKYTRSWGRSEFNLRVLEGTRVPDCQCCPHSWFCNHCFQTTLQNNLLPNQVIFCLAGPSVSAHVVATSITLARVGYQTRFVFAGTPCVSVEESVVKLGVKLMGKFYAAPTHSDLTWQITPDTRWYSGGPMQRFWTWWNDDPPVPHRISVVSNPKLQIGHKTFHGYYAEIMADAGTDPRENLDISWNTKTLYQFDQADIEFASQTSIGTQSNKVLAEVFRACLRTAFTHPRRLEPDFHLDLLPGLAHKADMSPQALLSLSHVIAHASRNLAGTSRRSTHYPLLESVPSWFYLGLKFQYVMHVIDFVCLIPLMRDCSPWLVIITITSLLSTLSCHAVAKADDNLHFRDERVVWLCTRMLVWTKRLGRAVLPISLYVSYNYGARTQMLWKLLDLHFSVYIRVLRWCAHLDGWVSTLAACVFLCWAIWLGIGYVVVATAQHVRLSGIIAIVQIASSQVLQIGLNQRIEYIPERILQLRGYSKTYGEALDKPPISTVLFKTPRRCYSCKKYAPNKFRWKKGLCPACETELKSLPASGIEHHLSLPHDPAWHHTVPCRCFNLAKIECVPKERPIRDCLIHRNSQRAGREFWLQVPVIPKVPEPVHKTGSRVIGFVFPKKRPGSFSTSQWNFYHALTKRTFAQPAHLCDPTSWKVALRMWKLRVPSHEPIVPMPFICPTCATELGATTTDLEVLKNNKLCREVKCWIEHGNFKKSRKQAYLTAALEYCATGWQKRYGYFTAFLKMEKGSHLSQNDTLSDEKSLPRVIQCASPHTQVLAGPMLREVLERVHTFFGENNHVQYAGGMKPEQLDLWARKFLDHHGRTIAPNHLVLETDYKMFDSTIGKEALFFCRQFYKLFGVTEGDMHELKTVFKAWDKPRGSCRVGFSYQAPYSNASGRSDTGLINMACNVSAQEVATLAVYYEVEVCQLTDQMLRDGIGHHLMVLGDDSLLIVPKTTVSGQSYDFTKHDRVINSFGFQTTSVIHETLRAATFLGNRPWPSDKGIRWGPTIGRCLYKLGTTLKKDYSPASLQRTMLVGLLPHISHVPILRDFAQDFLFKNPGPLIMAESESFFHWEREDRAEPIVDTFEMLYEIYGTTVREYTDFLHTLARTTYPCVFYHPLTEGVVEKDDT